MKKIYSEPTQKVVELDLTDGILNPESLESGELGGNGGEGNTTDEDDVKEFKSSLWDKIW